MAGRATHDRLGLRGHAGRSAHLARLLHKDCIQLLELYRKSESLTSSPVAENYLVSIPPLTPQLSDAEKISILHAALLECQRLLDDAITRLDEEFTEVDGEYKKQRTTVSDRLGHLLASTKRLLGDGKRFEAEVKEVLHGRGSFGLKMWFLRVLQDLVHWTGQISDTLNSLPVEMDKATKTMSQSTRRGSKKIRK